MEEVIYRPPFEAGSFLLQVTHGCSHNKCSFCTMYREVPFSVEPPEQVELQLRWAQKYIPNTERVFLESGDPFALSADRLLETAEMVHRYLPRVQTIAMYASVKNIMGKTDDDLRRLAAAGISDLNIGVESGLDEALKMMNKGYTAEQARHELRRLTDAGIDYGANIILGGAGPENLEANARATARLMNETRPNLIFTGTIHADEGCPLYEDMRNGAFTESTFGEYLDEEELFLSLLELEDCRFFGLHPSNVVQMAGMLPCDKEAMLEEVRKTRKLMASRLGDRPVRYGEGAIL